MNEMTAFFNKIPKSVKTLIAVAVVLYFAPGVVTALYEIGKEVGNALAYWI